VIDWRRKAETLADVRLTIGTVLDEGLPEDPYPRAVYERKVQAIVDHVLTAYGDDGASAYDEEIAAEGPGGAVGTIDIDSATADLAERLKRDREFAALVAAQLSEGTPTAAKTVPELIADDENDAIEFKSTARWNLRDGARDKKMEDAVVKTVAGFLNDRGGTLLIGIGPDKSVVGLAHDYPHVRPPDGDGFVNWLTTHLISALGATEVKHTRARIVIHDRVEICRVNVSPGPRPVWARTSDSERVFFVRMNNSTRALSEEDAMTYIIDRWPDLA